MDHRSSLIARNLISSIYNKRTHGQNELGKPIPNFDEITDSPDFNRIL